MKTFGVVIRYSEDSFSSAPFVQDSESIAQLLEDLFAQWNNGSGQECAKFLADTSIRSMSVGDFVRVDQQWYRCEGIGWKAVTQEYVDTWFDTLKGFLPKQTVSTFQEAMMQRLHARRQTENKLGIYCF